MDILVAYINWLKVNLTHIRVKIILSFVMFKLHMPLVCFSYRLADHPQLSAEFTKHLKRLPQTFNSSQDRALYRRLIDTYGTHYIHQVRWLIEYTLPALHTAVFAAEPKCSFQPSFHFLFLMYSRSSLVVR